MFHRRLAQGKTDGRTGTLFQIPSPYQPEYLTWPPHADGAREAPEIAQPWAPRDDSGPPFVPPSAELVR